MDEDTQVRLSQRQDRVVATGMMMDQLRDLALQAVKDLQRLTTAYYKPGRGNAERTTSRQFRAGTRRTKRHAAGGR